MKQGTRHGAASRRRERNERAHVWPSTNGRSLQRPPVCGVARWLLCLRFDGVRRVCGTSGQCVAVWRARGAFLALLYVWRVCIRWAACTCATRRENLRTGHVQTFENTCNVRGLRGVQLVGLLTRGVSVARSTLCGVLDAHGGALLSFAVVRDRRRRPPFVRDIFFAVSLACISDLQASANAVEFVTSSPWLARSVASGRARLHVSRWPFAARFRRSPCPFQGWRRVF